MVRSRTQMIPKLKEFRRPVRIIFGDADPSLNSGVARTFHEFLPGSELFLIPGARHFVQLDEPEQVARLILAMPGPGVRRPDVGNKIGHRTRRAFSFVCRSPRNLPTHQCAGSHEVRARHQFQGRSNGSPISEWDPSSLRPRPKF